MPHFSTTRTVNLTADQAYAIASDVNAYKDFLPLVKRSTIRGKRNVTGQTESFDADLMVGVEKLAMRETFTSHVIVDSGQRIVTATSSDGPMKSLKAVWKIASVSASKSEVSITVDYTFKSMMLQLMAGGMMDFAAQKIMQAFEERGRQLYGSLTN
jgi:coenzyme Q-binding protein COQ10